MDKLKMLINTPSRSKINRLNIPVLIIGIVLGVLNVWGIVPDAVVSKINQSLVVIAPVLTVIFRSFFTAPDYEKLEAFIIANAEDIVKQGSVNARK